MPLRQQIEVQFITKLLCFKETKKELLPSLVSMALKLRGFMEFGLLEFLMHNVGEAE